LLGDKEEVFLAIYQITDFQNTHDIMPKPLTSKYESVISKFENPIE